MFPWIVLIGVGLIVGLTPLAMYFTWVGGLYRRARPTVMSGRADLLAVQAGLAGFWVVGLVVTLLAAQSNTRLVLRGNWQQINAAWGEERAAWALAALGWAAAVGLLLALSWRARARSLAVVAVDLKQLDLAVHETLLSTGIAATRFGNVWSDGRELVAVDPAAGFDQAAVRFLTRDPRLVEELTRGLRERLARLPVEGRQGGWFRLAGTLVGALSLVCLGLLAYFVMLVRG